ncbi:MAG: CsbD family protein [Pseudomonadota bacterium]|nr:CsbD family protein [Pseudomonadota bacterium]
MALNENMIKGKWLEIKGDIQKAWGKLTDDELDKTKGDVKSISGLIQQKYGAGQDSYSKKVSDIFQRFETKKDNAVEGLKRKLKN